MEIGNINELSESQIREKIRELTKSFGIEGYDNSALWTLINRLIELNKEGLNTT